MEKELKIWHAFLATASLLLTVVGAIIVFSNKVENQRIRIEILESNTKDLGLEIKDLRQIQIQQNEKINDKLSLILIQMENKQNKK